jgi:2-phospho-L-lactate guanylyltransferase
VTIWAIVPVKPLRRSKSRLSPVLGRDERIALSREMLVGVLETIAHVPGIERTLLVSRDTEAIALARQRGARTLSERPPIELNQALRQATRAAVGSGASAVLVVPADLPLVTSADLADLVARAGPPPTVVIAPDRRGTGTNALFVSPAGLIEYDFGPSSFARHQEMALAAGARVTVCDRPGLALDLDLPEDLGLLREASGGKAA